MLRGPRGPGFQWPQAENRCIVPTLGRLMQRRQWPEREAGRKASLAGAPSFCVFIRPEEARRSVTIISRACSLLGSWTSPSGLVGEAQKLGRLGRYRVWRAWAWEGISDSGRGEDERDKQKTGGEAWAKRRKQAERSEELACLSPSHSSPSGFHSSRSTSLTCKRGFPIKVVLPPESSARTTWAHSPRPRAALAAPLATSARSGVLRVAGVRGRTEGAERTKALQVM